MLLQRFTSKTPLAAGLIALLVLRVVREVRVPQETTDRARPVMSCRRTERR